MTVSVLDVHGARPEWARNGSISQSDAKFLFDRIAAARPSTVVEIGTAAGVSTAIICFALSAVHGDGDFGVVSYDAIPNYYVDPSKPVGCALEHMLPPELRSHVEFRNPARAIDIRRHHEPESLEFVFIDASHKHPWPTLDLLATLDLVRAEGEVVLHDINLPLVAPEFPDWGAKHLFDDLDVEKRLDPAAEPPNIGSLTIPSERERVRTQLREILAAHDWEAEIPDDVTSALLP